MVKPTNPSSQPGAADGVRGQVDAPSSRYDPAEADPFGWALIGSYIGFVVRAPSRHKALAAGALASVLAVAIGLSLAMPVRYRVQAVVLAQRSQISTLPNPGVSREWDVPSRGAREIVIRRENLISLAKQVNMPERYLQSRAPIVRAKDWVYAHLLGSHRDYEDLLDGLVDTLQTRLFLYGGPEGTITISLDWSNRELAFDIVQAALESFLEERRVAEITAVGEAIAIFQAHDERVQQQIATTVEQVAQRERVLRLRGMPARPRAVRPASAGDEDLSRMEVTLATRRRALDELMHLRQQRLSEMQAQLLQQQAIYAPSHPTLSSTNQTIATLSRPSPQILALQAEVQELEAEVSRRGGQVRDVGAIAASADSMLAEARLRVMEMEDPRLETERRRLEDLLRQHSGLVQRIDSARLEMDTAQAAFKYRYAVVTPPQIPKGPLKPYRILYLVGGLLGGVAMAFFAATAADLRRGRVLERWQVEKNLSLQVMGEIDR